MESLSQALLATSWLCGFLNLANTVAGININAIAHLGHILKNMAQTDDNAVACAKFVAFANVPEDNPFMAGAFHGAGEGDCTLNVGISGPGVVRAVVEHHPDCDLTMLSEIIRRMVFNITRAGEMVDRELAKRLEVESWNQGGGHQSGPHHGGGQQREQHPYGHKPGAGGHAGHDRAALAFLIDAVKHSGAMASGHVGGLSGTFTWSARTWPWSRRWRMEHWAWRSSRP